MPTGTPKKKTTAKKKPTAKKKAPVRQDPPAKKTLTDADAQADLAGTPRPDNPTVEQPDKMDQVLQGLTSINDRLDQQQAQIDSMQSPPQSQWPEPQKRGSVPVPGNAPANAQPTDTAERDAALAPMLQEAAQQRGDQQVRVGGHEDAANLMSVNPGTGQQDTRHLRKPQGGNRLTDPRDLVPHKPGYSDDGAQVRQVLEAAPELVLVTPVETQVKVRIGPGWYSFIAGKPTRVPPDVARHLADKGLIATGEESIQGY